MLNNGKCLINPISLFRVHKYSHPRGLLLWVFVFFVLVCQPKPYAGYCKPGVHNCSAMEDRGDSLLQLLNYWRTLPFATAVIHT